MMTPRTLSNEANGQPLGFKYLREVGLVCTTAALTYALLYMLAPNEKALSSTLQDLEKKERVVDENQRLLTARIAEVQSQNRQLNEDIKVVSHKLQVTDHQLRSARGRSIELSTGLSKLAPIETELKSKASKKDFDEVQSSVEILTDEAQSLSKKIVDESAQLKSLAAKNQQDLELLKQVSHIENYEFELKQSEQEKSVGPVVLALLELSHEKGKYSVSISFQGTKIIKTDKYENEPIYFIVPGRSGPCQLVVNSMDKGVARGILSVPPATN